MGVQPRNSAQTGSSAGTELEWTQHYADWPDRRTSAGIYRCPGNGAGITRSIGRHFPWAGSAPGSCEHLPVGRQFGAPGRDAECEATGEPDVETATGAFQRPPQGINPRPNVAYPPAQSYNQRSIYEARPTPTTHYSAPPPPHYSAPPQQQHTRLRRRPSTSARPGRGAKVQRGRSEPRYVSAGLFVEDFGSICGLGHALRRRNRQAIASSDTASARTWASTAQRRKAASTTAGSYPEARSC